MTRAETLDRIGRSADAEQTGVRFQYPRIRVQATCIEACTAHLQIVIMEVWKSLGSAAND